MTFLPLVGDIIFGAVFGDTGGANAAGRAGEPKDPPPVGADNQYVPPGNGSLQGKPRQILTIEDSFEAEKDRLRELGAAATTQDSRNVANLGMAVKLVEGLQELKKTIQRRDVVILCHRFQTQAQQAAGKKDWKTVKEIARSLPQLLTYAESERDMFTAFRFIKSKYPAGSRFVGQLDFSKENPVVAPYLTSEGEETGLPPWEPSIKSHQEMELVQVYSQLTNSDKAEDRDAAAAVKKALDIGREDRFLYGPPSTDAAAAIGMEPITLEKVAEYTARLKEVYASPFLGKFQEAVNAKEAEWRKDNNKEEGYRDRVDFRETMEALTALTAYGEILGAPYDAISSHPDFKSGLTDARDYFVNRAEASLAFLERERERFAKEDEAQKPSSGVVLTRKDGIVHYHTWVSPRVTAVDEKIGKTRPLVAELKGLDFDSSDGLRNAFESMGRAQKALVGFEDDHAHALVVKFADVARKMVANRPIATKTKDAIDESINELEALLQIPINSGPAERLMIYEAKERDIRLFMAKAIADTRIDGYARFQEEAGRPAAMVATKPKHLLAGAIARTHGVRGYGEGLKYPGQGETSLVGETLDKYHRIRAGLESKDERVVKKALDELGVLEGARVHDKLREDYEGISTVNGIYDFTVGVGVVVAASTIAALATGGASLVVGGMAGEGLITLGVAGVTFTVADKALHALVYDKNLASELFQWSTLAECGLNTAMFAFMGGAMRKFDGYFEKGLEAVARRNVAATLKRELVVESKALMTAGQQALLKADGELVAKEMAKLSESLGAKGVKLTAKFLYETGKFTEWQFYVSAGQLALNNDPNPIGNAAKRVFSGGAILHTAAFLLALKTANAVVEPIFEPIHQQLAMARMGKQFGRNLGDLNKELVNLGGEMQAVFLENKGDLKDIAGRYRDCLQKRAGLLNQVPYGLRNDAYQDAVSRNQVLLEEFGAFRTQAGGVVELMGEGNRFGIEKAEAAEGGDIPTYDPAKRDELRQRLNEVFGGRNVEVLGDTMIIHMQTPGGETILMLAPRRDSQPSIPRLAAAH